MDNENINRLVNETINSLDGAGRAAPQPFLFTRITGKLQKAEDSVWDNALRFLSRPAVAMACVLLVIGFNTLVFTFNKNANYVTASGEELYAVTDEYTSTGAVAILNDIENIEP